MTILIDREYTEVTMHDILVLQRPIIKNHFEKYVFNS